MAGGPVQTPTRVTGVTNRPLLRNILVATDFSECSNNALRCALGIVRRYSSKLYLLNAVHSIGFALAGTGVLTDASTEARRDARQLERKLIENASLAGIEHEFLVEEGRPVEVIVEIAAAKNIDLIVLGTHGRSGLSKVLLGSCAEGVLRAAVCPVLTVGRWLGRIWPAGGGPQRILLLSDFSTQSNSAAEYALSVASHCGAELMVRQVFAERRNKTNGGPCEGDVMRRYGAWLGSINDPKFTPRLLTRGASTAEAIIQEARLAHADLIVMGVDGKSSGHPMCRFAYSIVSESECPVLTVPAQR